MGQLLLGGSSYTLRDYICATLLVSGTTLVSASTNHREPAPAGNGTKTLTGLLLIGLSLTADGFTGGLQKSSNG